MRIAVIGSGLIGRKHIALIADHPAFELAATVNPHNAPTDIMAEFGIPNFDSHHDLLRAGVAQAAIISSPNETHAEIAIDLLEASIPILIEKPIAASIDECRAILKVENRTGVPILVGHHRRYNPIIDDMRRLVEDGTLGALVGFSGVWAVRKPDDYYQTDWRVGPSGGPIMINLIHEIEYLQAMIGRICSVCAFSRPHHLARDVEATVSVLFQFENGVLGTMLLSDCAASPWTWEQATGENSPTFPQSRENPYQFLFKRGAVEFPQLKVWSQEEPNWSKPFRQEDRGMTAQSWQRVFADQLDHFHGVASGTTTPKVTALDGATALNAALAVRDAIARPGQAVHVDKLSF